MDAPPPVTMQEPSFIQRVSKKVTTKKGWFGNYNYAALCTPRLPCLTSKSSRSIFFGLNDELPILVAMLMGFQHALAMIGGVITIPRLIGVQLKLNPEDQAYLISTALIVSGLMTVIQIMRIRLVKGYYIGTGLISVSGVSFTFLSIATATIQALRDDGLCGPDEPCPDAYGKWLGTIIVGAFVEIFISFIPHKALRRTFPPIVTGITVFLIGAGLVPVGLGQWAGSSGPCKNYRLLEDMQDVNVTQNPFFSVCPNVLGPDGRTYPWGAPQWIGLGFFVFTVIVLVELFGSPFLRNTQVFMGLIGGIILAAALGYLDDNIIKRAPVVTFPLIARRFKLGFYAPALIPVIIGYIVSAVETIGDIAAASEASRVETDGPEFESRIQGGLLADGVNSFIAGLLTSSPTTTFSQNNGVIALTRCANRSAGYWAAIWLFLFGVLGKVGGVFVAMPDAVLGGMTTFLFANVAVSGLRILSGLQWTRRDRFILAISLGLGLGVVVIPKAFSFFIPEASNSFTKALRDGAVLILTSGYSVGALVAMLMNWLIPEEEDDLSPEEYTTAIKKADPNTADSEVATAL